MHYAISNDHIIWEQIGKQISIADLMTGRYCNIHSETGTMIWILALNHHSPQEISNYLSNFYNANPDEVKSLVLDFIAALENSKLIERTTRELLEKPIVSQFFIGFKQEICEPKISIYDEISSVLQLDPIDENMEKALGETGI